MTIQRDRLLKELDICIKEERRLTLELRDASVTKDRLIEELKQKTDLSYRVQIQNKIDKINNIIKDKQVLLAHEARNKYYLQQELEELG